MKVQHDDESKEHFQSALAAVRSFVELARGGRAVVDEIVPAGPERVEYLRRLREIYGRLDVVLEEVEASLAEVKTLGELRLVAERFAIDPRMQLVRFDRRALEGETDEPGETPS